MDNGLIEYPTGFGSKDIVAWGNTGMVCLDAASQTVIKPRMMTHMPIPFKSKGASASGSKSVAVMTDSCDITGLLTDSVYAWSMRLGLISAQPFLSVTDIGPVQRLRWVQQITDAVAFIHSVKVIHGDLTCSNVLTKEMDAKLGDFGGSTSSHLRKVVART